MEIFELENLAEGLEEFGNEVHKNAVDKGWYDNPKSDVESIALMITELAEAIEAIRNGNPPDKHVPEMDNLSVELADCVIRILDFAAYNKIDIGKAMVLKHEANKQREKMHGGKTI